MSKTILIVIFNLLFLTFNSNAAESGNNAAVNNYVSTVVNNGLNILNSNSLSESAKTAKIKQLVASNLDTQWMSTYALGNARKNLNTEQINTFKATYSNYITKSYTNLVKEYNGQQVKVGNIISINANEFEVKMTIQQDHKNINVSYIVHKNDGSNSFKVRDVIVEGASLIRSQQEEFTSIYMSEGFNKLIEALHKKS